MGNCEICESKKNTQNLGTQTQSLKSGIGTYYLAGLQENENARRQKNLLFTPPSADEQNFQGKKKVSNESTKVNEIFVEGNVLIPIKIINKALKSVCKIIINNKPKPSFGTGFFMKISNSQKYLFTNYHVISEKEKNKDIHIQIHNDNIMKLNLNNRNIKFFPGLKDITMIEIQSNDSIYKDIEFLDYDLNYKKSYKIYEKAFVFSIQYPNGENAEYAYGIIMNIDGFEFDYNLSTDHGSSGSPILLYTKNINLIQVIGIHKLADYRKKLNIGTFIGEIFNDEINNIDNALNDNYIIAEINIDAKNINKKIRILNSYEEGMKNEKLEKKCMNEKEIKNCEIKINDKPIQFNYFYEFKTKGKYTIKYSFNSYLNKTNHMFFDCSLLSKIDFSHFNTQHVTDMNEMFLCCKSLTDLNLSNFKILKMLLI